MHYKIEKVGGNRGMAINFGFRLFVQQAVDIEDSVSLSYYTVVLTYPGGGKY